MNFTDVFTAIEKGAVVLTVNQRLARHLDAKVTQAHLEQGHKTWASAPIISFDSWLLQSWQQRFDQTNERSHDPEFNKSLLSPEQALILWEQVIAESNESALLNIAATAQAASKARQLSIQWGISQSVSTLADDHVDLLAFSHWHRSFKAKLMRGGWVDRAQLIELVTELINGAFLSIPKQFVLVGFDVYTSTQKDLWALLERKGCELTEYSPYRSSEKAVVVEAIDIKEEMAVMAQWARERLQQSPDASIGIVVPELKSVRQVLESAFKAAFYPSVSYAVELPFDKPYNVSLGQALSSFPSIQQHLRWLQFFTKPLPLSELTVLLRSKFITAGHSEWGERARVEKSLREKGFLSCSIYQLEKELNPKEGQPVLCSSLAISLKELIQQLDEAPKQAKPSEWIVLFRAFLTSVNISGERALSSTEYQVFQAWDDVLRSFAALDSVFQLMDYKTALSSLRRMLSERIFQAETPVVPIQIMGLMEAAGQTFDYLWVCGLHDKCWPPAPQPSPFLLISEQRKQGLVQSSADLQYQQAKKTTQHWASSAKTVVFSYPAFAADTQQQMSPLLELFPELDKAVLLEQMPVDRFRQRIGGEMLSLLDDSIGPALKDEGVTRGGVGVLNDQSACPFKAFAHYRLVARALEEPAPGIDARLRGSLVHRALEAVWLALKSQQSLSLMKDDEIESLVEAVADQVIERESHHTVLLKTGFGALEKGRIKALLQDWLKLERDREPFEVSHTELKQVITVGKLQLNTAIDRVDRLQDGSSAIIDYKTGSTSLGKWFGERPDEPQLPLYSVFGSDKVSSISFAQLKKGDMKYVGLTNSEASFSCLKKLEESKADESQWGDQLAHWKGVLQSLSNEFMQGEARVNPTPKACDYCDLTSFCRINEQAIVRLEDNE